jgi:segregation and condensation protein B
VGRPLLYGTTPDFLRHFGLRNLQDLPAIDSFTIAELPLEGAPATGSDVPDAPVDGVPLAAVPAAEAEAPPDAASPEDPDQTVPQDG